MRALLLEIAQYDVSIFEFIGGEHTAKNVMIAATKLSPDAFRSEARLAELRKELMKLMTLHGVEHQRLALWMNELPDDAPGAAAAKQLELQLQVRKKRPAFQEKKSQAQQLPPMEPR